MGKAFLKGLCSISIAVVTMTGLPERAHAFEFDDGPIKGNIDTTLSFGQSTRVNSQDKRLVCTANGGTAHGCNADDGNLNYNTGTISRVHKITSDIEINHKTIDIGAFVRVKAFIDSENNNANETERTPLSDDAIDLVGQDAEILDAYVWKRFDFNNRAAEARFGKHVLNWGESTFIQGGINAINPIDVAAIRLPGSEIREALLPVNMLSMSADVSDNITVEGFYQFDWEETKPDPSGTYFSTNDWGTEGGTQVQLGFGSFSDLGRVAGPTFETAFVQAGIPAAGAFTLASALDLPAIAGLGIETDLTSVGLPAGLYLGDNDFLDVTRGRNDKPSDDGQWGVSLRYFSEELNDTEFGFYYMNYHSRLPIGSAITGSATGVTTGATALAATAGLVGAGTTAATLVGALGPAAGAAATASVAGAVGTNMYAKTASYFIEYPEDIQLLGVSFNTNVGKWALQGEYSYKDDVPLQIDDVELLLAALTPLSTAVPTLPYATNQLGVFGTDQYIKGYIERDVSQLQATATKVFPNIMGADEFTFVAEAAVTHVHDMPSKSTLRLEAPGTFVSGNAFHATAAGAHSGKAAEDSDNFADATSWGYRLAGRWTFNNVYKAINLQPRVAWQHDVDGITPGPGGNFIEDRKAYTLGMTATYKNQWAADISYTDFFGAGRHNLIRDRDFVAFNLKYSF